MAAIVIIIDITTPPSILVKKCATISSPPYPLNTSENNAAPTKIINTIEVVFAVSCTTCLKTSNESCFFKKANKIAPSAPTPADSVGVANPANIEPKTEIIKINGGINALKIFK